MMEIADPSIGLDLSRHDRISADPEALNKYKIAAGIADAALARVADNISPGIQIHNLCEFGDRFILEQTKGIFTKYERGIAHPTTVCVNHCTEYFSPLEDDPAALELGDIVKIELGVHIDGYMATTGATFIVRRLSDSPIEGRAADVICAAYLGAQVVLKMLQPNALTSDITNAIAKVAESFHCKPVNGVLSPQIRRFVTNAEKVILNRTSNEAREDHTIECDEVYEIHVAMSTGDGLPRPLNTRTTIFQRDVNRSYNLKLKAARQCFNEISERFSTFPFSSRALEAKGSRLGLNECINHGLLTPFPSLFDKQGDLCAVFSFTAIVNSNGAVQLTATPSPPFVKSVYAIMDPTLTNILNGQQQQQQRQQQAESSAMEL